MSSKLQLDVYDHNQCWRHLVNNYEIETGMVLFAGKTVWFVPEHLRLGVTFTLPGQWHMSHIWLTFVICYCLPSPLLFQSQVPRRFAPSHAEPTMPSRSRCSSGCFWIRESWSQFIRVLPPVLRCPVDRRQHSRLYHHLPPTRISSCRDVAQSAKESHVSVSHHNMSSFLIIRRIACVRVDAAIFISIFSSVNSIAVPNHASASFNRHHNNTGKIIDNIRSVYSSPGLVILQYCNYCNKYCNTF